jgi:hypothetical protein
VLVLLVFVLVGFISSGVVLLVLVLLVFVLVGVVCDRGGFCSGRCGSGAGAVFCSDSAESW